MKYENYNQIVRLVQLCEDHKRKLLELNERLVIKIHPHIDYRNAYTTISTDSDSEHDFAEYGRELINSIKADLMRRIANIEAQLETL